MQPKKSFSRSDSFRKPSNDRSPSGNRPQKSNRSQSSSHSSGADRQSSSRPQNSNKRFQSRGKNTSNPFNSQSSNGQSSSRPQSAVRQPDREGLWPVMKFPNVFSEKRGRYINYFTKTNDGRSFFDEKIIRVNGQKYRQANPERSKLFAGIAKGVSQIGFREDSSVLYLGASHGYTVSLLSDMVSKGQIYAMDFAPRVIRDLIFLCEDKDNIAPFMADAKQPKTYKKILPKDGLDVVFMDIAQKNQVEIFTKNCDAFLKDGGFGLLALKSRSVDVTKNPKDIFKIVRAELEENYIVVDYKELGPFEEDHALFVIKKR